MFTSEAKEYFWYVYSLKDFLSRNEWFLFMVMIITRFEMDIFQTVDTN